MGSPLLLDEMFSDAIAARRNRLLESAIVGALAKLLAEGGKLSEGQVVFLPTPESAVSATAIRAARHAVGNEGAVS